MFPVSQKAPLLLNVRRMGVYGELGAIIYVPCIYETMQCATNTISLSLITIKCRQSPSLASMSGVSWSAMLKVASNESGTYPLHSGKMLLR
jgi:hypothetical protein